jgi:hypothetical protein
MGKNTVTKERKSSKQKGNKDKFSEEVANVFYNIGLTTKEKESGLRKLYYSESIRYRENAKKILENAVINENGYYMDKKYVRMACGTAYSGLLIALDGYLILKNVDVLGVAKKDITFYRYNLSKLNKKLGDNLDSAYEVLHLWGYYDGITNSTILKTGFKEFDVFINLIKPV